MDGEVSVTGRWYKHNGMLYFNMAVSFNGSYPYYVTLGPIDPQRLKMYKTPLGKVLVLDGLYIIDGLYQPSGFLDNIIGLN